MSSAEEHGQTQLAPAHERERQADQRERQADQRERQADVREAFADLREREANRREREADEREAVADRREGQADEREEQIQGLIGELRGVVTGAHRDALEAIESSLALLSASADSFQRSEEAVKRAAARRRREEATTARAAVQDERQRAYSAPARQGLIRHAREIRTRLSATVAAFAVAEDNAARVFDQLATSHPERASAYQRKAQHARDAADRAREISRQLTD